VLPLAEVLTEMKRSLDFLKAQSRTADPRHQSLRAVFDASWDMLDPRDQSLYARLGIFPGGFDRRAAEHVAQSTLDQLVGLTDRSLLRRRRTGRFEIHPLLRAFARERLQADFRLFQESAKGFIDYYARYTADREPYLMGIHQGEALQEMLAEHENVRRAFEMAVEYEDFTRIKPFIEVMWQVLSTVSWNREGHRRFIEAAERLQQAPGDGRQLVIADLMARAAFFSIRLGKIDQAESELEQAMPPLRSQGGYEYAFALRICGNLEYLRADFEKAQAFYEDSLATMEAVRHLPGQTVALDSLGSMAVELGEYAKGRSLLERALSLARQAGDLRITGFVLNDLAQQAVREGRIEDAQRMVDEALVYARQVGHESLAGDCLQSLGEVAMLQGDFSHALAFLSQSLDVLEGTGIPFKTQRTLARLSWSALELGQMRTANDYLRRAFDLGIPIDRPDWVAMVLVPLAEYFRLNGQPHQAAQVALLARQIDMFGADRIWADQTLKALNLPEGEMSAQPQRLDPETLSSLLLQVPEDLRTADPRPQTT
jgi:tetratricopeptide (TPR) repeat protein